MYNLNATKLDTCILCADAGWCRCADTRNLSRDYWLQLVWAHNSTLFLTRVSSEISVFWILNWRQMLATPLDPIFWKCKERTSVVWTSKSKQLHAVWFSILQFVMAIPLQQPVVLICSGRCMQCEPYGPTQKSLGEMLECYTSFSSLITY